MFPKSRSLHILGTPFAFSEIDEILCVVFDGAVRELDLIQGMPIEPFLRGIHGGMRAVKTATDKYGAIMLIHQGINCSLSDFSVMAGRIFDGRPPPIS